MNDLIKRQDAIDALNDVSEHYTERGREWHPHVDFMIQAIEALPSAQQWIPAKEAEPQEDGKYLICDECGFIDTAFYEEDDFEIIVTPNRITAWMPLPEPWKGEKDAKER